MVAINQMTHHQSTKSVASLCRPAQSVLRRPVSSISFNFSSFMHGNLFVLGVNTELLPTSSVGVQCDLGRTDRRQIWKEMHSGLEMDDFSEEDRGDDDDADYEEGADDDDDENYETEEQESCIE